MIIEYCDPASDENLYKDSKAREQNSRTQHIAGRLWERGWLPKSSRDMDVELMAFDGRLVAIDYEGIHHTDWMYDPLDWHRSPELRQDTPHTAATVLACDEWNAQSTKRSGVWTWRRRAVVPRSDSHRRPRRTLCFRYCYQNRLWTAFYL